jgi:hypothetical protein
MVTLVRKNRVTPIRYGKNQKTTVGILAMFFDFPSFLKSFGDRVENIFAKRGMAMKSRDLRRPNDEG